MILQSNHRGLSHPIRTNTLAFYGESSIFFFFVSAILKAVSCVKSGTENLRGLGRLEILKLTEIRSLADNKLQRFPKMSRFQTSQKLTA